MKGQKVGIIVQARLSSSRLPSKVLACPSNYPLSLLEIGFNRLSRSKFSNHLVYAIPDNEPELSDFLIKRNISFFEGDPSDVMARYLNCAFTFDIDVIVRITADCPLVDPLLIDEFVDDYIRSSSCDEADLYLSNYTPPETSSFCNGSDIEIFNVSSLKYFYDSNPSSLYKEHVTFQFWDGTCPVRHMHKHYRGDEDLSRMRITVDYQDDLEILSLLSNQIDLVSCGFDDIVKAYFLLDLWKVNGNHGSRDGWN